MDQSFQITSLIRKKIKGKISSKEELTKSPDGFISSSYLFMLYVVQGNIEKAFDWVKDSLKKTLLLPINNTASIVRDLKTDERYKQFHEQIFKTETPNIQIKKKELLDKEATKLYTNKLNNYLEIEKPYLDSNLSLRGLAEQIDIHPNQLSWLINNSFGKNFNELINHYRVEVFKKISKDPKNANLTIEGLAYESGFNSKTVFNSYFKKETGLTPKQYLKQ